MSNKLEIKKTVYSNSEYSKVVDREFKTFAQPEDVPAEITIDEFFDAYEKLYYQIPIEGTTKSHTYLVARSTELAPLPSQEEDITPLLDEISQLREQLLEANQQIIELQIAQK